jgi:predicted O-methyltransferase YrrM
MTDFAEIKASCNGMMRVEAYAELHAQAVAGPEGIAVEIGTGHGAGAVTMALAGRDVWTIDRMEGGSRARYGNKARNLDIFWKAIEANGVASRVHLLDGDAGSVASQVPAGPIGVLFIDCDGRIDRDLMRFAPSMQPGAPIIIDDCADKVRLRRKGEGYSIDQKHRITALLIASAERAGILSVEKMMGSVAFCRRGHAAMHSWSADQILACYRQLVFGKGKLT